MRTFLSEIPGPSEAGARGPCASGREAGAWTIYSYICVCHVFIVNPIVGMDNPFLTRPRAVLEGFWVAHKVVRN